MEDGFQALAAAFPVFGLTLRTERLELRLPREDELVELLGVARAGVHDPAEMPFGFAWTDIASPQFERNFLQYHWRSRGSWSSDEWICDFGVWADGRLVGTQGIRGEKFAVFKSVETGSWIGRQFQGQGIGTEMRAAALAFAFDHLAAARATSGAFVDNAASVAVSHGLGYSDNGAEWLAPRGEAREKVRFLMTREMWQSRERPPVSVGGLDACRDMFGI
jgi:RimJ/RimL family protein N-acetyltransferase